MQLSNLKNILIPLAILFLSISHLHAQDSSPHRDTVPPVDTLHPGHVPEAPVLPPYATDTLLRITDLNPYFSVHVDSSLSYQLQINKNSDSYYWYIKSAPVGFKIDKSSGLVTFNANKAYFLSGKLKYDVPYKVVVGVGNMRDAKEKVEDDFVVMFYNTEIIPSRVKPTVSNTVTLEEGDKLSFRVFCEDGSFPVERIITLTSVPISNVSMVQQCGDEFAWTPSYDFVKETEQERAVLLSFVGTTRSQGRDTSVVKVIVKNAQNYPLLNQEHAMARKNIEYYVNQLKYTFLILDKKLKKTKSARTGFDLTAATTSLTGTILNTSSSADAQKTGKILPSVGVALVPIKEASVPTKNVEQNQATLIRSSIKRLEYMLQDNQLVGDKDPDVVKKTNKLKDELQQVRLQLLDVPLELATGMSPEELDRYFNSPKVNKKYRLKG